MIWASDRTRGAVSPMENTMKVWQHITWKPLLTVGLFFSAGLATFTADAETLRINGSTTVNPIVVEAAEILRSEKGMTIHVDVQGGSSGGIAALGDKRVEIGMSSKPLDDTDRAKFPDTDFHPIVVGYDILGLIVSKDVWEGGVQAISRAQMQQIYESKVKRWNEIGGPDRRIAFFNKEPGRGTWKVFATWLYGKADLAPQVSHPEVGSNEETRSKVGSTKGAISQLSAAWADHKLIFPLAIRKDDGTVAQPNAEDSANGSYPLSRGLFLITDGEPKGDAKVLIDLILSPRGQKLVEKHGYLPLKTAE